MNVLVVDNYDSFTFNLTQLIEESGCTCDVVSNDHLRFKSLHRYDKILISPGSGIPSEAGRVCDLIRAFSQRKSILGICLGHQAIAEVFGGRLMQLPHATHGVRKLIRIIDESNYLFEGLHKEIEGGLYHSWTVSQDSLPHCLKVTAVTFDGTIMALSHREYDVSGLQFHPESVMTPEGQTIMRNWLHRRPLGLSSGK